MSAVLGLTAVTALAGRDSRGAQLDGAQPLALPPMAASLLSDGRKQTFCITNRTSKPVDYRLYWGGTTGRHYELGSGHHMIHSSANGAAPLVEFFDSDFGEPIRKVIGAAVMNERAEDCWPNYSFVGESSDRSGWSGGHRFGLYGEKRPEVGNQRLAP